MAALPAVTVLFLFFNFIHGLSDGEKSLVWPKEYHVKGEKFEFHTGILLPFEIWYSETYGRSRIDLDGGTVKNYYGPESNHTHGFAIHPVSNDQKVSQMKCYVSELSYQPLLLNATGLKFTGRSTALFGKQVDEWESSENYEEVFIRNQTLYVYTNDEGQTLPIRNIEKVYITVERGVMKHTVIDYHLFDTAITENDVKLPLEDPISCQNVAEPVDTAFNNYMNVHNKKYHDKEIKSRRAIFEENWKMVNEHNRKNAGFTLQLNEFSDRTDTELKYLTGSFDSKDVLLKHAKAKRSRITLKDGEELPQNYDSREEGLVTSVKHQGYCGSCWAFATTAAVETAIGKANGTKLLNLSEQSLVDCGWTKALFGCQGGSSYFALSYVKAYGIPTRMDYGDYKGIDGVCKISDMPNTHVISDVDIVYGGVEEMKMAVYKYGVVAASVNATNFMTQYSSGIFYEEMDCESTSTNHAIVIVGYGVHEGEDYWLVKNSWGEAWGEAGYMRMSARNCFISDFGMVPVV